METVLNALLIETQSLIVLVLPIILKPSFKKECSVKFVMLDVTNVVQFSTCVMIVLTIP
jgi:hypothetical protein